jgi:hypothetical protein
MLILIIDFIDSLLDKVKQLLDMGDDFYDSVRSEHHRIPRCLVANDAAGARKTMIEDVVEVRRYLALELGEEPLDPEPFSIDGHSSIRAAAS